MGTRLEILFQKELYSVAVNMAVNYKFDKDRMADVYKRYGDYLYEY